MRFGVFDTDLTAVQAPDRSNCAKVRLARRTPPGAASDEWLWNRNQAGVDDCAIVTDPGLIRDRGPYDRGMPAVTVPTSDGPIDAVLESPREASAAPWPGVVVVHDALGVGRDIRDITARVAEHGYLTLTPDLYSRGGRTRCVVRVFRELLGGRGRAVDDLVAARDLLAARPDCTGKVGVVGFCMGGGFALVLATEGFDVSAPFYGPLPRRLDAALRGACPIVGSYGARDPMLWNAGARLDAALGRVGVDHDVQTYPGVGHSFANRLVSGSTTGAVLRIAGMGYDAEKSADAWRRVFEFFDVHLSAGAQ